MPEIIDQANELAERRLEMTIQNMRINHNAVSATHCRDCGEEIPGAPPGTGGGTAVLTVRKKRNYAVSIGGDMASGQTDNSTAGRRFVIASLRWVIYRLISSWYFPPAARSATAQNDRGLRVLHI